MLNQNWMSVGRVNKAAVALTHDSRLTRKNGMDALLREAQKLLGAKVPPPVPVPVGGAVTAPLRDETPADSGGDGGGGDGDDNSEDGDSDDSSEDGGGGYDGPILPLWNSAIEAAAPLPQGVKLRKPEDPIPAPGGGSGYGGGGHGSGYRGGCGGGCGGAGCECGDVAAEEGGEEEEDGEEEEAGEEEEVDLLSGVFTVGAYVWRDTTKLARISEYGRDMLGVTCWTHQPRCTCSSAAGGMGAKYGNMESWRTEVHKWAARGLEATAKDHRYQLYQLMGKEHLIPGPRAG